MSEFLPRSDLKGLRILVVEDDALVATVLKDYLQDLEISTVGPIPDIERAMISAKIEKFDFALLDVNLRGTMVYPVAEALNLRGIPFALMTGQDAESLPHPYGGLPSIQKPYAFGHIERYLRTVFNVAPDQV